MGTTSMKIGAGVLVVAAFGAFVLLALKTDDRVAPDEENGYEIRARFDNVGGLKVGSPVTMAGVRIGQVTATDIDSRDYTAVVTMSIRAELDRIPIDTSASILTAGLLGERYVELEAGGETRYLKAQDEITFTQSALVLEHVIGQFLYNRPTENTQGN